MHAPRSPYLEAINRIFKYLKGTPEKRIWMKPKKFNNVCGYFDVDWTRSYDKKLIISFCTFIDGNLIT
jgi:hypothetical protein